jgi:hypothetical protein
MGAPDLSSSTWIDGGGQLGVREQRQRCSSSCSIVRENHLTKRSVTITREVRQEALGSLARKCGVGACPTWPRYSLCLWRWVPAAAALCRWFLHGASGCEPGSVLAWRSLHLSGCTIWAETTMGSSQLVGAVVYMADDLVHNSWLDKEIWTANDLADGLIAVAGQFNGRCALYVMWKGKSVRKKWLTTKTLLLLLLYIRYRFENHLYKFLKNQKNIRR